MKKNKIVEFFAPLIVFLFLLAPLAVNAALVPCGRNSGSEAEKVPCTLCHFIVGIKNIIDWGMGILTFVAIAAIVLGGIFYIISAGNQEMMTKAKNILIQTLTGFAIVLGAWLIVTYSMYIIGASNKEGFLRVGKNWYEITCDLVSVPFVEGSVVLPTPTTPTTPTAPSGTANEIAQQILGNSRISLVTTGDCKDASGNVVSPRRNIQEMADSGRTVVCNSSCKTSGTPCTGSVVLNDSLLQGMITAANSRSYTVISISGGQHSLGSVHYSGRAVDVSPHTEEIVRLFSSSGANNVFCDFDGSNVSCASASHVHASF
jgi:hypothetical protein